MKRYPNDPMYMSAYDFYDLGVSMQRSKQPSKIYVPNDIQVPEDIQVPPNMQMPNNFVQMPNNNVQMPHGQMPMPEEDYEEYNEAELEEDKNYMISLYPDICRRIQQYVDEECDQLDYEGSIMYDEYPDKEAVMDIVGRIYFKVEKECQLPKMTQSVEEGVSDKEKSDVKAQQYGVGNPWLWDNVQVVFLNELFGRRRRRYPRRYYQLYPSRYRYYRRYPRYSYYNYQPYVPYNYRYYY